jgi:hypothetical protein
VSTGGGPGGNGGTRPRMSGSLLGGGQGFPGGGQGVAGGLGDGQGGPGGGETADSAVVSLLKASTTRWAAATNGAQSAAPLQLAGGKAVMAIGGFTGSDPAPTLAAFQQYVAAGEIHYYIGGGPGAGSREGGGRDGGRGGDSAISDWVAAHYTATTVGGTTVYDLTKPAP